MRDFDRASDNPTGADNQQETARLVARLDARWVCGFVDGEGCFSVSIHRNQNARSTGGWQLHPVFHVYQHGEHRAVLEALVGFFGCGNVRPKRGLSPVWTYAVDSSQQLQSVIVPFFQQHPLVVKAADFDRFAQVVAAMRRRDHLNADGFERVVRIAYAMNAHGKQRKRTIEEILAGSSETARQAPERQRQPLG
jgi:LAGLIDADG endonuclease